MIKLLRYFSGMAVICAITAPLMMLLEVAMDLMQPKLMADIIDIGVANRDIQYITSTGWRMILVAFLGFIGGVGCSVFSSIATMDMGENLRQGLFDKIQGLSFLEIDKLKTSSLITRMTNDVTQIQNMAMMGLRIAVRAPLLCVGGIIMAYVLSSKLSTVFIIVIPIIIMSVVIILRKSFPLFTEVQKRVDKVNDVMRESILGIRVIKAFTIEKKQSERFESANMELMSKGIEAQNMNMILWPVVTLVMNLSIVAVLWFGGNMVFEGSLEIGRIMAFINYLVQVMSSLIMVVMLVLNFSRAKASADRINEVFDTEPAVHDSDTYIQIQGFDIEFRNVSFKYNPHSDYVLRDISVKIKDGEKIGIIGATGSGKSTFVNLIPRLYDVTEGQVLIGGEDVKNIKIKELREKIGVVLQESVLFSGTIEDNLKFGNNNAGYTEMENAACDAQAHDFIMEKEKSYHSVVEQRGKNYSGGQKQRMSIARALIKHPRILIMDDASSALDMSTEAKLQEAIAKRMTGSTVITIAQRISGVIDADRIIVLDNGRLEAVGSHHELMDRSEIYRSIAVSQLGEEVLINA